ncbi:NAD-dependent epimerase/dehydratase family protein [Candidatus Thioglobus sp.]|uniref:NAD-dependent epimerase/dehydratase family protein n=1 Tax=Candidatus Pseudothioglobus sp. Uisw_086 TaxID=3230998 RepID=UPI0023736C60|nr:NAD-dependent epimerase/dehydratase family protein [Candidatus Thioglobus sp.]
MYLITGASGFIGKRLVNALKLEDARLTLMARKKISGCNTIICDLESNTIPNDAMNNIDIVIHLAGYAHDTKNSDSFAYRYKSLNVDAVLKLANLASNSGVKKFIFISSVKASGAPFPEKCMTESDQGSPRDLYGKSKREAELELLKISNKSKMEVTILRPALVYGPNVKGNLLMMMSSIKKGWFPPLPKKNNRRSMVHIDDLVKAVIFISKDSRTDGEIINITDGKAYSSREIYEVMCNILERPIPKWSMPLLIFKIVSLISFGKLFDFEKLFANEYFSSDKLNSLGFSAERSLGDMNETNF